MSIQQGKTRLSIDTAKDPYAQDWKLLV